MRRKVLLMGLATIFFVLFILFIQSEIDQSKTAEVPRVTPSLAEVVIDPNTKEDTEETDLYTFLTNPSTNYYELNTDYVGWIQVGGTVIDYPVVRGQDNEFYLDHDFYKEKHVLGAIFMDYRNIGMGLDKHTILYGHHAKTGVMFAELKNFLSKDFTDDNPTIAFQDSYTDRTYQVFSVHVAPASSEFIKTSFKHDELEPYFEKLKTTSQFPIESEFKPDLKILTLISCNYTVNDGRIYVHAYEVTD